MRIKHKLNYSVLSAACFSVLILFIVTMLCPTRTEQAEAVEGSSSTDSPVSAESGTLAIAISKGNLTLSADPTANNGIVMGSVEISAKTSNETGYVLNVSTSGTTVMKSTDTSNTSTIQALSSNTTLANFPANRWGYYAGNSVGDANTTYKPFSTSATEISSTTSPNSSVHTKYLTVAAKVDSSLPASSYNSKIIVSLVAQPPLITAISTMQDMTNRVCKNTDVNYEKTLTDTRDGKKYKIRKMLDGRCWMVQNLELDLTTNGLKASDTNITEDWNSTSKYKPQATFTNLRAGTDSSTAAQSWDLGKWVNATPFLTDTCGGGGADNVAIDIKTCIAVGFVDVSNTTNFKPTYAATTKKWEGQNANNSTLVAVNCTRWGTETIGVDEYGNPTTTYKVCTAGTYDPHYLIGNYYSWNAATAGTGGGLATGSANTYAQAAGSICPKGWRLPTAGENGEFANLLTSYGVLNSYSGTGIDGNSYHVVKSPLRFTQSGSMYPDFTSENQSKLYDAGGYIFLRSSTYGQYESDRYELWIAGTSGSYNFIQANHRIQAPNGTPIRCINDHSI